MRGAERSRLHTELPEQASHPPVDAHNPPQHVQSDGRVHRFGPFELDASRKTLVRGENRVDTPIRGLDVLSVLLAHAGELVSKETLFERAWPGLAVTDNSIVQAVKSIREAIGTQENGEPYIENRVRSRRSIVGRGVRPSRSCATAPRKASEE